jgi:hypothetical protein
MTESMWIACANPWSMVNHLGSKASDRKRRHLACACLRRFWHVLRDEEARKAVETAERFADGMADADQLQAAQNNADAGPEVSGGSAQLLRAAYYAASAHSSDVLYASNCAVAAASYRAFCDAVAAGGRRVTGNPKESEEAAQRAIAQDMFGNPFRPVPSIAPLWLAWNDGAIRKMAQAIYDGRAFGRLPLLADALEEAGCTDADILSHCRSDGEHVRGCWVVDLILGKE